MLVTDDTGNVQSLYRPAQLQMQICLISLLMRYGTFKWIQLKSNCRYNYDSFVKSKYIMCTSTPSLGFSIFGFHLDLKKRKNKKNLRLKAHFYKKCHILKTLLYVSRNKNDDRTSSLGIQSKNVKKVFLSQKTSTLTKPKPFEYDRFGELDNQKYNPVFEIYLTLFLKLLKVMSIGICVTCL